MMFDLVVSRSQPTGLCPRLLLLATCLILVVVGGCVRRRLTIRSTPPGATVYVDDQPIGTTPVSTGFTYYGVRSIRVMKDGYRTETIKERIRPPWYQYPPLDFISENLWPRKIRDERIVDIQMIPEPVVPNYQLLDRADSLRHSARNGHVIPVPTSPDRFGPAPYGTPLPEPMLQPGDELQPLTPTLPPEGIPLDFPSDPRSSAAAVPPADLLQSQRGF